MRAAWFGVVAVMLLAVSAGCAREAAAVEGNVKIESTEVFRKLRATRPPPAQRPPG